MGSDPNSNLGLIPEADIEAVTSLPRLDDLKVDDAKVDLQSILSRTVILKLNGGLGTSMV